MWTLLQNLLQIRWKWWAFLYLEKEEKKNCRRLIYWNKGNEYWFFSLSIFSSNECICSVSKSSLTLTSCQCCGRRIYSERGKTSLRRIDAPECINGRFMVVCVCSKKSRLYNKRNVKDWNFFFLCFQPRFIL